jgi:hypothetical protein
MADAEVPQTQKESDMSIFKRAQHDDINDASREEPHGKTFSIANWNHADIPLGPLPRRERVTDAPGTGSHESPFSHADRQYREAIEQCRVTSSDNQTLRQENADLNGENNSLHREVSRLQAKVDALELDNRTIRCFAQSLKTRLHAVAEACDKAIAESLTEAAEEVKKEMPQDDPVPAFLTAEMPSQAEG